MAGSINHVVLVGTIGKYGVELRYHTNGNGTPYASFMLVLVDGTPEGKYYTTMIPCECWGKRAEAATELEPGTLVAFGGKLKRQKKAEQWEMCVSGLEVTPITQPEPVASHN